MKTGAGAALLGTPERALEIVRAVRGAVECPVTVKMRAGLRQGDGGWLPQLDDSLTPIAGYFVGKPDLYHALQACLIPLYPTDGSLTRGILGEVKGMA